jgi:hypothetical protein
VATASAYLNVRATFRLKNTGNRQLTQIEAILPSQQAWGRYNQRVNVDGREVVADGADDSRAGTIGIPFNPPWPQKSKGELIIEYRLPYWKVAQQQESTTFYLDPSLWFPQLRAPPGRLSRGSKRSEEIRLTIRVPQDFRVAAAGSSIGSRSQGKEIEYRFGLSKEDFGPFVVAGRYHEQQVSAAGTTVFFWTLAPLPLNQAQKAGARLAATVHAYETAFGPRSRRSQPVWIVETPQHLDWPPLEPEAPAGHSFPGGALLNRAAFALGVSTESFLDLAERELARTWFGQIIQPRLEAQLVLGEAATVYATIVAAEAREGAPDRMRSIASLLLSYDEIASRVGEKPLLAPMPSFTRDQREGASYKGALFFLALEDSYGKDSVRHTLSRLVRTLRGEDVGLAELRAALELESWQNLAQFFRTWLSGGGIPDEFRSRYAAAPITKKEIPGNERSHLDRPRATSHRLLFASHSRQWIPLRLWADSS